MNTIRSLSKWALPLLGVYMVLIGLGTLIGLGVPTVIMGLLALVIGILLLLGS